MLPQSLLKTRSNTVSKKTHKENIFVIIINLLMTSSLNITAGCPWGEKYLNILSNSVKQTWTLRFREQTIGKNLKQCLNLILFSLITLWQTETKTHLFYDKVGFPRALASRRVGPRIDNSILHIHQLCVQCEEHLVSVIKNNSSVDYWSAKG